ncbi:MAG: DUF3089 domain-containing protein [Dehalococcoidia bacterium]
MRWLCLLVLFLLPLAACRDRGDSDSNVETSASSATSGAASSASVAPHLSETAIPIVTPTGPAANGVAPAGSTPVPGVTPVDYSADANWLCRGTVDDLCSQSRTVEVLSAGLHAEERTTVAAAETTVDCFYVYPTVSTDSGVNSDLEPGAAERGVIIAQAAPFSSACRVFAPLYRQLTITALTSGKFGDATGVATAYGDVVAAWEYYLAHDNNGRRVVLIGHSQGATVLKRLIQDHIDSDAAVRGHLAAAFLLGTAVSVPSGSDVGGDFQNIPACGSATQMGCVIAYSTFNEASPPPPLSLFGRVAGVRNEALCVDPAELTGGGLSTWLTSLTFRASARTGHAAGISTSADYIEYSGLISSRCVHEGNFTYLAVGLNAEGDAWGVSVPPYITGEVWGLHNLDVSISVGNLVRLVRGYK